MNEREFIKEVENLGLKLTEEQLELLKKYAKELLSYNEHTNLTAIKTIEDVYLKHFYDSLTLIKILEPKKNEKLLDIGSGAGFPGLVLAIIFPNLQISLLDSNHKKIDFLNHIISILNLKNVNTIYDRCEIFSKKHIEEFDYITSRAVAELRILLEISFSTLKIGGTFIAMKSSILEEQEIAKDTIDILNAQITKTLSFKLPNNSGKRTILEINKKMRTPSIYPRVYPTILKKPLKKKNI